MPLFLLNTGPRPRRRWLLPLLLLTLLSGPLAAQHDRRYWEADGDSLRRVLDTQRTDTARLRTLEHLFDVGGYKSDADYEALNQEQVQLARRLRRPDARALQLFQEYTQLFKAKEPDPAVQLKRLQACIEAFDSVGRPIPNVLAAAGFLFRKLNQTEEQLTYFQAKLAQYQARGTRENICRCHHALGAPFVYRGDYNQAISHYLHAADIAATYDRGFQENELKVVGTYYAEWGNTAKALYYLRQSLAVHQPQSSHRNSLEYTYRGIAQAYRQLHNYPAALRYARLS